MKLIICILEIVIIAMVNADLGTTTTTTTLSPTSSTTELHELPCEDLFDANVYLKSICYHRREATLEEASDVCLQSGMKLIQISSRRVQKALFAWTADHLKAGTANVWIDRLKTNECTQIAKFTRSSGGGTSVVLSVANCNIRYSFVCEYTKASLAPITGGCDSITHMFNLLGEHQKAACYFNVAINYDEAVQQCKSYNMNLLTLTSNVDAAFYRVASVRHLAGSTIWINGSETQQCMSMQNYNYPFQISTMDCSTNLPFYCEF